MLIRAAVSPSRAADSYYEYLIKQHQLIGGATDQFSKMYGAAMDKAEKELFMDVDVVPGEMGLFVSGDVGVREGGADLWLVLDGGVVDDWESWNDA